MDSKEEKLYQLIRNRALASQAAAAKMMSTTLIFANGNGQFKSNGVRMLFDGFLRITGDKTEETELPELKVEQMVEGKKVDVISSETSPPPRYSDASLVGALENQGIGRPSTYAPIISTILDRQYVERDEGRFIPTKLGEAANEFLVKNFPDILSLPFTAGMEENLDEVARGKAEWREMMKDFWGKFEIEVKTVEKDAERVKVESESLGQKCPECGEGELVVRVGRFGKFVSCSRFPECKYKAAYKEDAGFACPTCGASGVVKRTKTGKKFYGCSRYPECKWAGWKKP